MFQVTGGYWCNINLYCIFFFTIIGDVYLNLSNFVLTKDHQGPKPFLPLLLLCLSLIHKTNVFCPLPLCTLLFMEAEAVLTSVDAAKLEICQACFGLTTRPATAIMAELLSGKNEIA